MEKNVFLVKWFGPFYSRQELDEWQQNNRFAHNLYLLHGRKKFSKKCESYYCGMTMRTASKRLKDKGHHIEEIGSRDCLIYVGRIVNKRTSKEDVKLVEKLITSYLDLHINCEDSKDCVENRTNFYPPKVNVYIINEWVKPYTEEEETWQRIRVNSPAHIVPDVMQYYSEDKQLFGVKRVKNLGQL